MVAEDFLLDARVRQWLGGVEPAWTLLTFESLRALRREPSAVQTAIRIANDLGADEVAGSPVARNTLILLRQATERDGLPLTATGNLSRAVVAEMCKLIQWPDYDQADAFRLHEVINEPDFLPLHVVRQLAQAATFVRAQRGKLVATPLGKSMLSNARQRSLLAILFHIAFWHSDLGYFGRGLLGVLATGGCRYRALVALGLRQRLANQRAIDAALHHSGASDVFGDVGQDALRDGVANPATAAVVWATGVPQRKNPGKSVHGPALLSQGGDVRPAAHFRCNDRRAICDPALSAG
jgi:hypothetical protein